MDRVVDVYVMVNLNDVAGPVITLAGEVDMLGADEVRDAGQVAVADAPAGAQVTIDLGAVTFLDSTGLGALVAVSNAAHERGVPLLLRSVPERIAKLLAITGLEGVFATEP